jgi:hypothetical protein
MKHHAMNTHMEVEVQLHAFLALVLQVSGELHALAVLSWYPLDRRLERHQSQYGHGGVEKNLCPCLKLNPSHPALTTNLFGISM